MTPPSRRIQLFDVLRGAALLAMAGYHFSWDLEFFGLADLGVTEKPLWVAFAKTVAGSFLALVGVSLVLAHRNGVDHAAFTRRLLLIVAAAEGITLMSYLTDPGGIIWFGILHCIAVSSVLGLLFLRAPLWFVIGAACVCIAAPHFFTSAVFDSPGWLWLGLASDPIPSNDYDPLLPWFGAVLIGVTAARIALARASNAEWVRWQPASPIARTLAFGGRHSLVFYLLHQPVLMGLVWCAAHVTGRA